MKPSRISLVLNTATFMVLIAFIVVLPGYIASGIEQGLVDYQVFICDE